MKKYKPIEGMVVAFAMHHKASQELNGYRIFESNEIQAAFDTRTK